MNEHMEHLRRVLVWLRKYELHLKKEKCKFDLREIKFLGRKVDQGTGFC